jgi:pyroglutamyl-peptidase
MKAPILITGFHPFAGHPANPSKLVARALAGRSFSGHRVRSAVLPVVYAEIEEAIDQLLAEVKPAAVVSLGLDYKTDVIKLERIAINLDDASIPDEADDLRSGTRIALRGPAARWSTLPLDSIAAALAATEVPFKFSSHAGAFLCNHLMYHLCGRAARARIPAGFIHLPPTPEIIRSEEESSRPGVLLESQIAATRVIVRTLAASLDETPG